MFQRLNSLYLVIHQRLKGLKDREGIVIRRDILDSLKYPIKIDGHIREIVIRELCELGLLVKVSQHRYKFVESRKSDKIWDINKAQIMAGVYRKRWFKDI